MTRFAVRRSYLARYSVEDAGGREHQEYSTPAEELRAFNDNIIGVIEVIAEFR